MEIRANKHWWCQWLHLLFGWWRWSSLWQRGCCYQSSDAEVTFFNNEFSSIKEYVELFQMHIMEELDVQHDLNYDHINFKVMCLNGFYQFSFLRFLKNHVSLLLINKVRKPSVEPIFLSKRWGIAPEIAHQTIQTTMQREIRTMLHPLLSRWFRTNYQNLCYCCLAHPVFSDKMFAQQMHTSIFHRFFGWAGAFPMVSRCYLN